jgi:predicted nuclease with TOPRIM domain
MKVSMEKEISDIDEQLKKLEGKLKQYQDKEKELLDQIGTPGMSSNEPAKINLPKTMEI